MEQHSPQKIENYLNKESKFSFGFFLIFNGENMGGLMNRKEYLLKEIEMHNKKKGIRLVERRADAPKLSLKMRADLLRNYKWKIENSTSKSPAPKGVPQILDESQRIIEFDRNSYQN